MGRWEGRALQTWRDALLAGAILFASTAFHAASAQQRTLDGARPLVIAHRGASGYLPEHTLAGYALAIEMGADVIEPDLVITRDGVLIVRHEPMLSGTTDVADRPEFAARRAMRKIDGLDVTDWFAFDFTLAEIKQLRAKQAMPERDQSHNGKLPIPTFQEVIDLAKSASASTGRTIAIYPETKHSTLHAALGLRLEDRLVATLQATGWTTQSAPVFIQSFEPASLRYLRPKMHVRLVQLVDGGSIDKDGTITAGQPYDFVVANDRRTYKDLLTKRGLAEIRTYADGVSLWKSYLLPSKLVDRDGDGKPDDLNGDGKIDERDRVLLPPTSIVKDAHDAGLFVHTWTFRSEPRRLISDFKGDPALEYKAFFALGIDGLFSDFPDAAVKAR
jgi:glycerophosphoryl diester phosphodiesterase